MKSLIRFADRVLQRYTPDPFVIAIVLTAITYLLAVTRTEHSASDVIQIWGNGIWTLAEFTMQMAMILLGGFVVATSPPVKKLLISMIGFLKTPTQAVLFCTFAAIIASWINWGFGLVVGGVVAVEVSRRLPAVSFRLLVASSYSGFLVWHAGLSGSIPLALNTASELTTDAVSRMGTELVGSGTTVPLSLTLFSSVNLVALASIVILLPILNWFMVRVVDSDEPATLSLDDTKPTPIESENEQTDDGMFIENSWLLAAVLGGMAAYYLVALLQAGKFSLNLNSVNFIFFMTGLVLHGSPAAFLRSVTKAVPKIAPILIQYPLYAGIMRLLIDTGLGEQISAWFVSHSTADTLPFMTFLSAGLVNLFVPSGGGQWAVQAPIVLPAAQELGADFSKTIMAVAWGDAWTNMLQPFWAVPLLTIAGLKIKDIIGLLLVVLLASGIVLSLVFLLL